MPTLNLGLPLLTGNMTADVVRDMNALAEAVDAKAGSADGLATLGADGKVPSSQLSVSAPADATTTVKGIVMLEDSVTSTSVTKAATPKAVKTAMDRADAAFLQANDIKGKWASVVGSPLLSTDTSTVLQSKTQTIKNDLATNLTAKGQSSVGTETLDALIDKVALVSTGKKWASGTTTAHATTGKFTVTGLSFVPSYVVFWFNSTSFSFVGSMRKPTNIIAGANPLWGSVVAITSGSSITYGLLSNPANTSEMNLSGFIVENLIMAGYPCDWIAIE